MAETTQVTLYYCPLTQEHHVNEPSLIFSGHKLRKEKEKKIILLRAEPFNNI